MANELQKQLAELGAELDRRTENHRLLDTYYEGSCPLPVAVTQARLTKLYRYLMPMAEQGWGALVVDSVLDRLEPSGIRSDDRAADAAVWGFWQDNAMDAESKLAHSAALVDGRAHALVWPGEMGTPEVRLDDACQMVVCYEEGSRRKRLAAMRRWVEGDRTYATLYRPEAIYKFEAKDSSQTGRPAAEMQWQRRELDTELWPLPNPLGVVPVVEIAVNRRLAAGKFAYAKGEFERNTGLLDRINLLTFLGLVVAVWMGFPLRGVIGQKVLVDDSGDPIAPFEAKPDSIVVVENPEAKFAEFGAADRKNLSILPELAELAMLTKTPRHYFPQEGGISNVSADTIRADEGALHAKVTGHKATLGEGWEEVLRLGGAMLEDPVDLSQRAELQWHDHESRSLAERADAASKLKDVLPGFAVAEVALNATYDQISRWEAQQASSAIGTLLAGVSEPVASGNGAGA